MQIDYDLSNNQLRTFYFDNSDSVIFRDERTDLYLKGGCVSMNFRNTSFDNATSHEMELSILNAEVVDIKTRSDISEVEVFCIGRFNVTTGYNQTEEA